MEQIPGFRRKVFSGSKRDMMLSILCIKRREGVLILRLLRLSACADDTTTLHGCGLFMAERAFTYALIRVDIRIYRRSEYHVATYEWCLFGMTEFSLHQQSVDLLGDTFGYRFYAWLKSGTSGSDDDYSGYSGFSGCLEALDTNVSNTDRIINTTLIAILRRT